MLTPGRSWPRTVAEALAEQERLRPLVDTDVPRPAVLRTAGGLDAAYATDSNLVAGAVVVLDVHDLTVVDSATALVEVEFPYVPGLLALRELPALLAALERLVARPDVLVCDGHGLAHPRRFGLACHLGVLTDTPTLGVAKTPYWGSFAEPGPERGSWTPMIDGGDVIGRALRTRAGARPVYVSPGHLIDAESSSRTVLRLAPHHRLPETTRLADQLCRRVLAVGRG